MIIKQNPDGTWGVYRGPKGKQDIAGPFQTNADAWRWMDRETNQPVSRAEEVSDWIFQKSAGGTGL